MFFKNAQYRVFTKPFLLTVDELNEKLKEQQFSPLTDHQISRIGWVNPLLNVENDYLVCATSGLILLKLHAETKDIKTSTIKKRLQKLDHESFLNNGRKLTFSEKKSAKEQIVESLLPTAQTNEKTIYGFISVKDNLLVVNSASARDIEDFCGLLRKSIVSLPISIMHPYEHAPEKTLEIEPQKVFTNWLLGENKPKFIELGFNCLLHSDIGDAKANLKNQDLTGDEVKTLIENGKRVQELSIGINNITLTITKDLILKSMKFNDAVYDKNDELEDMLCKFEADFIINSELIIKTINELNELFFNQPLNYLENKKQVENLAQETTFTNQQSIEETDELINEALLHCTETNTLSISSLQRKLRIGYNRSARLIETVKRLMNN